MIPGVNRFRGPLLRALLAGEAYSLEIIERVKRESGVRLSMFNIYPALRGLEDEGLVTSREGDPLPERGGRARRYYELTDKGREQAATAR